MTWLKNNVRLETWITIAIIVAGFVATNAVRSFTIDTLKEHEVVQDIDIKLNSTHRIVKEAEPAFVPRIEFENAVMNINKDVIEIKAGQKEVIRILLAMK